MTKKHTKKSQKLKFIKKKLIIKLSLTNRISLTSATTSSRQPSAFPRNVPSRSTFHSGEFREIWNLSVENFKFCLLFLVKFKVKQGHEIAAQELRVVLTQPKEAFYREFPIDSVNGECFCPTFPKLFLHIWCWIRQ